MSEIAGARRCGPDANGLVGGADVRCIGVGVRIDRDGAQSQPCAGPHDPDRDFAAVGDQQERIGRGEGRKSHFGWAYMR